MQGHYLHKTTQIQNERRQTVGFEPTISAFERAKTFHTSDRAATVFGIKKHIGAYMSSVAHGLS
jgi:hypothetical protein